MKKCTTCTKAHKDEWLLGEAEAAQHKDRYPKHVLIDAKDERGKGE